MIKYLRQLLREAQRVLNLREDISEARVLRNLDEARRKVSRILKARDWPAMEDAGRELEDIIRRMCPPRSYSGIRENFEIILVAVAVAMAFRTYFIQPFKIPTSSMAPTLNGIHFVAKDRPGITDRLPSNLVKWLVWGEWYVEVRAKTSGQVRIESTPEGRIMLINGIYHPVNKEMADHVATGDDVVFGQLLASGIRVTGDHIFVDKVSWNFRMPARGEIMVFKTAGINHLQIKTNEHYVKRMVGLPCEFLSIKPPNILINGQKATDSRWVNRVENHRDGYDGYQLGGRDYRVADYLARFTNNIVLGKDQYFACGDNQYNSLDSRYWGPVERKNLVGPAVFIYWPVSRHWGLTE
jgi:signal peptidase I